MCHLKEGKLGVLTVVSRWSIITLTENHRERLLVTLTSFLLDSDSKNTRRKP